MSIGPSILLNTFTSINNNSRLYYIIYNPTRNCKYQHSYIEVSKNIHILIS